MKAHSQRVTQIPERCYACRTCQIICSFHHTGSFWPEKSSIQVRRDPQRGLIYWNIDSTCDKCQNEKQPQCVKYCTYQALQFEASDK